MRIGIVARVKQGDILEALEREGWNQRQGAEFLGIPQTTFCGLINLKQIPKEFSAELTVRLYELTGKMPEELFPDWARQRDFLEMPKVARRFLEVTPALLQQAGATVLSGPEEVYSQTEVRLAIDRALYALTPRERKTIQLIMEGDKLEEVAQKLAVTRGRIGQIRDRALRKLRHPDHSRRLRAAFDQIL